MDGKIVGNDGRNQKGRHPPSRVHIAPFLSLRLGVDHVVDRGVDEQSFLVVSRELDILVAAEASHAEDAGAR